MKKMAILLAVTLVLAMVFPAAAEEYGWKDYAMKLEGTPYTLVLPEGVDPVAVEKNDEGRIGYAKLGSMTDPAGGMSIEVIYITDTALDDLVKDNYDGTVKRLIKQYGEKGVLKKEDIVDWSIIDLADASGTSFAVTGMYKTLLYDEPMQYECTDLHAKGSSTGMMIILYIPAENGVYAIGYFGTRNYIDSPNNLFYGTILDE